jgi:formylglycine-generating enzyme required for sulfatase activity
LAEQTRVALEDYPVQAALPSQERDHIPPPVAQSLPNAYGLYDISATVWECVHRLVSARLPRTTRAAAQFLCTSEYFRRYMLGTRGNGEAGTGSKSSRIIVATSPARNERKPARTNQKHENIEGRL